MPTLTARAENAAPRLLTHRLESLRLVRVAGPERGRFLQGQITQDVTAVSPTRSALFGWTTAQGRLLVTGQLFDWRDAYWLSAPNATSQALVRRLRMFVLRAKVTVDLSDMTVVGLSGTAAARALSIVNHQLPVEPLAALDAGDCFAARLGGDTRRVLVVADATSAESNLTRLTMDSAAESAWRLADIRAGLPWIGPETFDLFIPQMVNLDLIGGVSFTKGCYAGQEIVTRTRHLGRIKRRMLRFRCAVSTAPNPGDVIFGPERESGRVISATSTPEGTELLAVTQLDDAVGPLFADPERRWGLLRLDLPYGIPEIGGV